MVTGANSNQAILYSLSKTLRAMREEAVWLALSLAEMVLGSGFLRSFRSSFQDGCKFVKGSAVTKEVGAHSRPFALNKSSLQTRTSTHLFPSLGVSLSHFRRGATPLAYMFGLSRGPYEPLVQVPARSSPLR